MLKVLCTLCIFLRKFPICIVVRNWGRRKLKRRNLKLWVCRANSLCVKVFCFLFILDFFSKKKYFSRCPRSQSYCPFPGQCKRLFHCSALGVQTHEFVVLCLSNGGTFSFCVILSLELAFSYNKCNLNRSLFKVFQIPFANLTKIFKIIVSCFYHYQPFSILYYILDSTCAATRRCWRGLFITWDNGKYQYYDR